MKTSDISSLSPYRLVKIVGHAIDCVGETLNGRALYDALAGELGLNDEEIITADFTALKEFMEVSNERSDQSV